MSDVSVICFRDSVEIAGLFFISFLHEIKLTKKIRKRDIRIISIIFSLNTKEHKVQHKGHKGVIKQFY